MHDSARRTQLRQYTSDPDDFKMSYKTHWVELIEFSSMDRLPIHLNHCQQAISTSIIHIFSGAGSPPHRTSELIHIRWELFHRRDWSSM
jgi:hypothetical protein